MKKHEAIMYGFIAAGILTAGFFLHGKQTRIVSPVPSVTPQASIEQSFCHATGNLPDPNCQFGSINPAVIQTQVQDTTHSTICKKGWTATIRPPVSFTNALKLQQLAEYDYTDRNPKHYEEDHLVPLEVGGNPSDPHNLWPEPLADAHKKDIVENLVHNAVCNGSMTLYQGQMIFLERTWQQYYQ